MNLTAITPPPPPPVNLPSGPGPFGFPDSTAGPILHDPLIWLPCLVIGGGIFLVVLAAIAAASLTQNRQHRIKKMAPGLGDPAVDRLTESLRNPIAWVAFAIAVLTVPAGIIASDAYAQTTTTSDPLPAWQKTAEAWARSTYGVTTGLTDLAVADDCVIPSTKPCAEATVEVAGHLERVQLAYPSGVPVLVSMTTKQTLPAIGETK